MPTSNTIGRVQLDEFVDAIPRIYSRLDQSRTITDVWLHANHHAAAIGEEVRKDKPGEKLLIEIADFSMWLFTLIGKLRGEMGVQSSPVERPEETLIRVNHDYSDLLWNKYPYMCPVCYWRRTEGDRAHEGDKGFDAVCDCMLHDVESRNQNLKRKHVKAMRAYANEIIDRKPRSVDEWQRMFGRVFRANLPHLDLTKIAFHLLEEMGEVSDAMARMYTYRPRVPNGEPSWRRIWLEEELSDVTSWLFALVGKLEIIPQTANAYDWLRYGESTSKRRPIRLSGIIWRRYGLQQTRNFFCPHCKSQTTCTYKVAIVPSDLPVDRIKSKAVDVLGL